MFTAWQVVGPRGGFVAEFFTKKAALAFVKHRKNVTIIKKAKELASASR